MTRLIAFSLVIGLATTTTTTTAEARGLEQDTCVECGGCDPFETIIDYDDFDLSHSTNIAAGASWNQIRTLDVEFSGNPHGSHSADRSGDSGRINIATN